MPAGVSRLNLVVGASAMGIMPVSRSTVATQMALWPDIIGAGGCGASLLCNDKAVVRLRVRRREDEVCILTRVTARFEQEQLAERVGALAKILPLLAHCRPLDAREPADNYACGLTRCMAVDHAEHSAAGPPQT
eukprot:scaffold211796_cov39-Tisochrysis_lutea.AAC.1